MVDLSLPAALGILALIGAGGFAFLGFKLGSVSSGRRDAPSGNPTVIKGYWSVAAILLVAGAILVLSAPGSG